MNASALGQAIWTQLWQLREKPHIPANGLRQEVIDYLECILREETDGAVRDFCWGELAGEASSAYRYDLAVAYSKNRVRERADPITLTALSRYLFYAGEIDRAMNIGRRAVRLAIARRAFINDAAASLIRLALDSKRTADAEYGIRALNRTASLERETDGTLKLDWLPLARKAPINVSVLKKFLSLYEE